MNVQTGIKWLFAAGVIYFSFTLISEWDKTVGVIYVVIILLGIAAYNSKKLSGELTQIQSLLGLTR